MKRTLLYITLALMLFSCSKGEEFPPSVTMCEKCDNGLHQNDEVRCPYCGEWAYTYIAPSWKIMHVCNFCGGRWSVDPYPRIVNL